MKYPVRFVATFENISLVFESLENFFLTIDLVHTNKDPCREKLAMFCLFKSFNLRTDESFQE